MQKVNQTIYVPIVKVNLKIQDIVIVDSTIEIEGRVYQELSKKPRGRIVRRRLNSLTTDEQMLIYS